MKASIIIVIAFQIWLIWQKFAGIGVVCTWPWPIVLMPLWLCLIAACVLVGVVMYATREDKNDF